MVTRSGVEPASAWPRSRGRYSRLTRTRERPTSSSSPRSTSSVASRISPPRDPAAGCRYRQLEVESDSPASREPARPDRSVFVDAEAGAETRAAMKPGRRMHRNAAEAAWSRGLPQPPGGEAQGAPPISCGSRPVHHSEIGETPGVRSSIPAVGGVRLWFPPRWLPWVVTAVSGTSLYVWLAPR
jgi:hypothetical protein